MMFRRLFLWLGLLLFVSACVAPTSTPKAIPAFVPTTINISTVAPTPTIAYAENYADAISITEFGQDNSPHLSWLPDNKTLIVWSEESTGSKSGEIRFMDSTNWQEVRSIKYKESIYYVGVDTEGRYLLINDSILDFNSEQYLYSLVPGGIPRGFSKNGEFIIGVGACGTLCGELRIWDAHTGKQQSELSNFADGYPTFALSPDDQIVAFGDWQTRVTYWDVASGERLGSPIDAPPSGYVSSLTYSLDGKILIAGVGYSVWLFDVDTGKILHQLKSVNKYNVAMTVSPNNKMLSVAGAATDSNNIQFWEVSTGNLLYSLTTKNGISDLVFTPDGGSIIWSGSDGKVRLLSIPQLPIAS